MIGLIRKTWRSDKWISDEYSVGRDTVKEIAKRMCENKEWIKNCDDGSLQQKGEVYNSILVEKIINEIEKEKPSFDSKKLSTDSIIKLKNKKYFSKLSLKNQKLHNNIFKITPESSDVIFFFCLNYQYLISTPTPLLFPKSFHQKLRFFLQKGYRNNY